MEGLVLHGHPAPLRWLIGIELARYRNEARLSLTDAAARTGYSRAKIGHLETGRQQQDSAEIGLLLRHYGASQDDVNRLISLIGRADEASWWAPWALVVPDWFTTFVGLEGLAEREFVFEPIVLPGLLQTEEYAAAVTAETPRVRGDHGERFVGFRVARAGRLTDPDHRLELHAVLTEAALRLAIGDEELRQAQLRHLVTMAALPNVTIQVVRPEDGLHAASHGQFVVLNFESVRSIGYVELHDGAVYLQDPDQVLTYTMVAKSLSRTALDPERSVELIKSMIVT
jgi:transcriptional regulator with XRE-family HTH domain